MFDISKYFKDGKLISIDINPEQIKLVKNKINLLSNELYFQIKIINYFLN